MTSPSPRRSKRQSEAGLIAKVIESAAPLSRSGHLHVVELRGGVLRSQGHAAGRDVRIGRGQHLCAVEIDREGGALHGKLDRVPGARCDGGVGLSAYRRAAAARFLLDLDV